MTGYWNDSINLQANFLVFFFFFFSFLLLSCTLHLFYSSSSSHTEMSFLISQSITAHILGSTCAWQNYLIFTPTAIFHLSIRNTKFVQCQQDWQQSNRQYLQSKESQPSENYPKNHQIYFSLIYPKRSMEWTDLPRTERRVSEFLYSENKSLFWFPKDFRVPTHLSSAFKLISKLFPCEKREHILKLIAIAQVELQNRNYFALLIEVILQKLFIINRVTIYYPEQLLIHKTPPLEHLSLHIFQIFLSVSAQSKDILRGQCERNYFFLKCLAFSLLWYFSFTPWEDFFLWKVMNLILHFARPNHENIFGRTALSNLITSF